jgi:subtilisin family serine protease
MKAKQVLVEDLGIWLCEYEPGLMNDMFLLNEVRKQPSVQIAQFNHYVTQRSSNPLMPNDTQFGSQWSLNNTGQNGGTVDADIDAPEAWALTTGGVSAMGDSIIVAIIDGGFYITHPDIKFWKNYAEIPGNGIDDDGNGYIDDFNGWNAYNNTGNITTDVHGTHCSGIAGAIGNNNLGVSGVNWGAKIMSVQGSSGTESVVLIAYGYVYKMRKKYNQTNGSQGAFVVSTNSSFGVDYGQPANFPLWCAFYDSLGAVGILSACATANLNINVDTQGDIPTACPSPFMVSVTNTTNTDAKNSGAAYGLLTIDLGAPGTNILSTTTSGNYGNLTGTSMATPHVAGAIALMYASGSASFIQAYKNKPDSIALIVKQKLLQGVDPKPSMTGTTVSGGRLNVYNSILLLQNPTSTGNIGNNIPVSSRLYENYPNPFNPSTIIRYDVSNKGFVSIKIYDILGREAATLVSKEMEAGSYQAVWNAKGFSSGLYYFTMTTGSYTQTRKMALIK